jgi:hypothetical protein
MPVICLTSLPYWSYWRRSVFCVMNVAMEVDTFLKMHPAFCLNIRESSQRLQYHWVTFYLHVQLVNNLHILKKSITDYYYRHALLLYLFRISWTNPVLTLFIRALRTACVIFCSCLNSSFGQVANMPLMILRVYTRQQADISWWGIVII